MTRRWLALFCWAFGVWVILTWTWTTEQLVAGIAVAAVVALACAPLGPVAAPWALLRPKPLINVARLSGSAAVSIVRANLSLSRRIWSPSRPLTPGMVVVPTAMRSEAGLTGVGLISSLIVDNQLVDLDLAHHQLQYHAVEVDSEDPQVNYGKINGPIERYLTSILAGPSLHARKGTT
jgi:multicomponent Na+:H+ antiporter subunit E